MVAEEALSVLTLIFSSFEKFPKHQAVVIDAPNIPSVTTVPNVYSLLSLFLVSFLFLAQAEGYGSFFSTNSLVSCMHNYLRADGDVFQAAISCLQLPWSSAWAQTL